MAEKISQIKIDGDNYSIDDILSIKLNILFGNDHPFIDLGLPSGTLWATCNIGANSPEEIGDYYAFGESETKTEYTSSNYTIVLKELTKDNDTASIVWSLEWKIPTSSQVNELLTECTWTYINENNIKGYLVKGLNDNKIFLPFGGRKINDQTQYLDEGYYLINYVLRSGGYYYSKPLYLTLYNKTTSIYSLYLGINIRPVVDKLKIKPELINTDFLPNAPEYNLGKYNISSLSDSGIQCIDLNPDNATWPSEYKITFTSSNETIYKTVDIYYSNNYKVFRLQADNANYDMLAIGTNTGKIICHMITCFKDNRGMSSDDYVDDRSTTQYLYYINSNQMCAFLSSSRETDDNRNFIIKLFSSITNLPLLLSPCGTILKNFNSNSRFDWGVITEINLTSSPLDKTNRKEEIHVFTVSSSALTNIQVNSNYKLSDTLSFLAGKKYVLCIKGDLITYHSIV